MINVIFKISFRNILKRRVYSSINVSGLALGNTFTLLFASLLIAFPSAWWAYEQTPGTNKLHVQPWIFILGAAIIFSIVLIITSSQIIKAATRNPVEALRYE
jgi:putative ABC transport system permease protein